MRQSTVALRRQTIPLFRRPRQEADNLLPPPFPFLLNLRHALAQPGVNVSRDWSHFRGAGVGNAIGSRRAPGGSGTLSRRRMGRGAGFSTGTDGAAGAGRTGAAAAGNSAMVALREVTSSVSRRICANSPRIICI